MEYENTAGSLKISSEVVASIAEYAVKEVEGVACLAPIVSNIGGWLLEKQTIEVAPLAYMRGRTLDDSFIILDEAQNTTPEQMKMFLTRLGFGSKIVITGDITQIDLPADKVSGLKEAMRILRDVEDIAICRLSQGDVVRHVIVQRIIKAYEDDENRRKAKR